MYEHGVIFAIAVLTTSTPIRLWRDATLKKSKQKWLDFCFALVTFGGSNLKVVFDTPDEN